MKKLVTKYPHIQRVVSQQFTKQYVLSTIKQLRNEGKLKSRLKIMVFERYGVVNEVIPLSDI